MGIGKYKLFEDFRFRYSLGIINPVCILIVPLVYHWTKCEIAFKIVLNPIYTPFSYIYILIIKFSTLGTVRY